MSKSELKRQAHLRPPVVNVLVAYPYFTASVRKVLEQESKDHYRLIVDSGAFTAHQSGKPISLDGYCKFLDSISHLRPFDAVQLDVIGNHEATLKNYMIMRGRGYDVMPVFTRGSPLDLLDELYKRTDYVLIGGVAFGDQRRNYVKYLTPALKGRKYHLLGFTDIDFIKTMRPYSVDSSAWESGGRYGVLYLYEGFGKFGKVGREKFFPRLDPTVTPKLQRMGLKTQDIHYLLSESAWRGGSPRLGAKATVRFLGGYAHVLMGIDVERYLGTKCFLALTTNQALEILLNSRSMIEERMKEGLL